MKTDEIKYHVRSSDICLKKLNCWWIIMKYLTVRNERSRATRTFVSMLVLFFLLRPGTPSKPRDGEDRELGLGRVLSIDMVSVGKNPNLISQLHLNQSSVRWSERLILNAILEPTCIIEPLLQQWLQLAHVLKAKVKRLKARNGGLAEVIPIQLPHG